MILPSPNFRHSDCSALAKSVATTRGSRSGLKRACWTGRRNVEKDNYIQLSILIGGAYKGSEQHMSLKAGGNDEAQLTVAQTGVDLPSVPETADDDPEALNHRTLRNQYEAQTADFSVDSDE